MAWPLIGFTLLALGVFLGGTLLAAILQYRQ
jgi:hypothetical protein